MFSALIIHKNSSYLFSSKVSIWHLTEFIEPFLCHIFRKAESPLHYLPGDVNMVFKVLVQTFYDLFPVILGGMTNVSLARTILEMVFPIA